MTASHRFDIDVTSAGESGRTIEGTVSHASDTVPLDQLRLGEADALAVLLRADWSEFPDAILLAAEHR